MRPKKKSHEVEFCKSVEFKYTKCWHCENFFGPCFGEPLCKTCHLFLYPGAIDEEIMTSGVPISHNESAARSSSVLLAEPTDALPSAAISDAVNLASRLDRNSSNFNQIRNMIEVKSTLSEILLKN